MIFKFEGMNSHFRKFCSHQKNVFLGMNEGLNSHFCKFCPYQKKCILGDEFHSSLESQNKINEKTADFFYNNIFESVCRKQNVISIYYTS